MNVSQRPVTTKDDNHQRVVAVVSQEGLIMVVLGNELYTMFRRALLLLAGPLLGSSLLLAHIQPPLLEQHKLFSKVCIYTSLRRHNHAFVSVVLLRPAKLLSKLNAYLIRLLGPYTPRHGLKVDSMEHYSVAKAAQFLVCPAPLGLRRLAGLHGGSRAFCAGPLLSSARRTCLLPGTFVIKEAPFCSLGHLVSSDVVWCLLICSIAGQNVAKGPQLRLGTRL
mmetsp:Transcript_7320/g.22318  ORF Transcript_7320/g.22318 Transcript_7320/m.22318 type:complete len:222 (+) Transcript_7320:530-1195(+)